MTNGPSNSQRKRIERLEALTQSHSVLIAKSGSRPLSKTSHRDERLAITVDVLDGQGQSTYPSQTGTGVPKFPIKFIDASYTQSTGWETLRTLQRGPAADPYDQIAASVNGDWLPIGTIAKAMWQRPPKSLASGDSPGEWFVETHKFPAGRIGFKMTGPRLRLRQSDGTRYGTATAIVEWIVGEVPVSIGDSVTVNFPGIRWAEAVKNCEGEADYFTSYSTPQGVVSEDIYVVTECQGLPLRIAFITTEDRSPFSPDQDVRAVPLYAYGAAQDDLPIADWYQVSQGNGQVNCGQLTWSWFPNANRPNGGDWNGGSDPNNDPPNLCCIPDLTPPPIPADPTQSVTIRKSYGTPGPNCEPPTEQPEFFVRFPQLTFPRSLEGADGHAILDNAIWSDDPNDMRYVVDVANQQSTRIKGTLPGDNCGSSFALASVEVCDFWPFSQKPKLQQTIQNTHKGFSGYWWWASWNETLQAYEVRDMKKTTMFVGSVGSSTDQQGCTTIVSTYREVDLETCKQPTAEVLLQYRSESKKFLKKIRYDKNETTIGSGEQAVTGCQPVLYSEWEQANVLTLCSGGSTGEDFINLAVETVVRQIVGADGCLHQVFTELIVWGQCGDDTPDGDALLCVAPWECPTGSGSGQ